MRSREFRLPNLSWKTWGRLVGAILLVCVVVVALFRFNLTDYSNNPDNLDELPFYVFSADEDTLTLVDEWIDIENLDREERIALEEEGPEYLDYLRTYPKDIISQAQLIVKASFTGERTYGYQSFVSNMKVNEVIAGEGVEVGDILPVYEGFIIESAGGGLGGSWRYVDADPDYPSYLGMAPMRQNQEYLLFLSSKRYPDEMDVDEENLRYRLVRNPYSMIATDVLEHPELVSVSTPVLGGGAGYMDAEDMLAWWPTFEEASTVDHYVRNEDARELYLATCADILEQVDAL